MDIFLIPDRYFNFTTFQIFKELFLDFGKHFFYCLDPTSFFCYCVHVISLSVRSHIFVCKFLSESSSYLCIFTRSLSKRIFLMLVPLIIGLLERPGAYIAVKFHPCKQLRKTTPPSFIFFIHQN